MRTFIIVIIGFGLIISYSVSAYVISSENYRIQSDSINVGGLDDQESANYMLKDTIGEDSSGESASASYNLKAGYRQMDETFFSISSPSDVTMSPSIGGVTGGTGNGQAIWTVTTDNPAGYVLSIKASTDPALKSGSYSFADYTPSGGTTPDYNWSIISADSEFGFTPEGSDIVQKFKDNSSACNTGSNDTSDKCWYDLSTSDEDISNSSSANHPSGTATTVKFRAQSGSSHLQAEGSYTATVTVTAIAN